MCCLRIGTSGTTIEPDRAFILPPSFSAVTKRRTNRAFMNCRVPYDVSGTFQLKKLSGPNAVIRNLADEVFRERTMGPFPSPLLKIFLSFRHGLVPKNIPTNFKQYFIYPSQSQGAPELVISLKRMIYLFNILLLIMQLQSSRTLAQAAFYQTQTLNLHFGSCLPWWLGAFRDVLEEAILFWKRPYLRAP